MAGLGTILGTAGGALIGGPAGAAIGGSIGGAIDAESAASGDRDKADALREQALAQLTGISLPDYDKMQLALQHYQITGEITPELEAAIAQGPSAFENINVDPRLKANQMQALEQMSGLASGDIKPSDMAGFELARRNAAAEAQAKQGQILQEMQQRGQAGSGAELLARMTSAQSGADRLQQAQLQQAQAMQQAREAAISNMANMAGNIRSQDYSQASDLARARDIVAQQNVANARQVQAANVAAKNQAKQSNWTNAQDIANRNVDIANQQQQYNNNLARQKFEDQLNLGKAKAGALSGNAQASDTRAGQTADMWSGIGSAVGKGITAYGQKE